MRPIASIAALGRSLSGAGLILSALFFAISLTPSLLPRPYVLQGLLSGFALAAGYGLGVLLVCLYEYLQIPPIANRFKVLLRGTAIVVCLTVVAITLVYTNIWQNQLRQQMSLPESSSGYQVKIALIALLLSLALLFFARLIIYSARKISRKLNAYIPPRVARLLAVAIVVSSVLLLTNDLVVRKLVATLDDIYAFSDSSTDTGVIQASNPLASGSSASLIPWSTLGRTGQNFVTSGPQKQNLDKYFASENMQPLRVYVGYRSADTVEARAQLALSELIRVGGFERSTLIIATPTGTGWQDPPAVDSVEYLHRGDSAIVTMQYSYLPSWLTLLLDPAKSKVSAAALFRAIHGHWRTLPAERRPDLYLFGLSLGALGAETSIDLPTLISDPIQGAVLAGPPFPSSLAPRLMRSRNPGSPQWLPVIQDSSIVRFTGQANALDIAGAEWGPMRFVYIQYASDPMVFFSTDLYWREPDWMRGERGHDVSRSLTWYPVVTFLQLLFDLPMADRIPRGNAHNYSASSYIDAWIAVTQPENWNEANIQRLKKLFATSYR